MVTKEAAQLSRAFQLFSRTSRAQLLYDPNNAAFVRMMDELSKSFDELLGVIEDCSIKVRPEALLYQDEEILREENPDESVPFIFYRDGIRRLDLSRGLDREELEVLVSAAAQGFSFSGIGDDVVSTLWRHELEHVRYLAVDTLIVDAPAGSRTDASDASFDVDAQIDGLLRLIYGPSSHDDVGPRSIHIDATDIPAQVIAQGFDAIDDLAPGFHPPRTPLQSPSYAEELMGKVAEDEHLIGPRVVRAVLAILERENLSAVDQEDLTEWLLRMFDAVVVGGALGVAAGIVSGVRALEADWTEAWLKEAVSEVRLRQVASIRSEAMIQFFAACGPIAVASLTNMLPSFSDKKMRRRVAEHIATVGLSDLTPLEEMLVHEEMAITEDALHILVRLRTEESRALLNDAGWHPNPNLRQAVLEMAEQLEKDAAIDLAIRLLQDEEPEIRALAAAKLSRLPSKRSQQALDVVVKQKRILPEPLEVKRQFLAAHAQLHQERALGMLESYLGKGGLLAKKEVEELAISATRALARVRTPRSVEILKAACSSRSKQVQKTAREILLSFKENK